MTDTETYRPLCMTCGGPLNVNADRTVLNHRAPDGGTDTVLDTDHRPETFEAAC